jgi:hypothetical protein
MKRIFIHFIALIAILSSQNVSSQFCSVCDSNLFKTKPILEIPIFFLPMNVLSFDIPNRKVMPHMGNNISIGGSYVAFPFKNLPVGIELRGSLGGYAWGKENMQFTFDSTNITELEVQYKSNMNKAMLGLKFVDVESGSIIKPYASVFAGYAFMRSRIYIPDPQDETDCEPLENKLVHKFNGFVYGAEAGIEFNLNKKLRKNPQYKGAGIFLYTSVGLLRSHGNLEYINVKHRVDELNGPLPSQHIHHNHPQQSTDQFTATFINLSSNQYHTHKVAELYRTPMNMWNISLGLIFRL